MDEQQQSTTEQEQQSNLNPFLVIVVLIIVSAVGVMFWLGNNKAKTTLGAKTGPTITQTVTKIPTVSPSATVSATAVTVEGGSFYFKPNVIKVKKGETVKITLNNVGGLHDLVIDAYNVKTERIANGKSATVSFVADKVGTFEYYCSVGNHRQMGMTGKLIVE